MVRLHKAGQPANNRQACEDCGKILVELGAVSRLVEVAPLYFPPGSQVFENDAEDMSPAVFDDGFGRGARVALSCRDGSRIREAV